MCTQHKQVGYTTAKRERDQQRINRHTSEEAEHEKRRQKNSPPCRKVGKSAQNESRLLYCIFCVGRYLGTGTVPGRR